MYLFTTVPTPPPVTQTLPTWQAVQARGYLRVGVKDNLPPLGMRDAQGHLIGFEIEIARELAQELLGDPRAVRFVVLKNTERLAAFERVDMVIAQITRTNNRQRLVDFSLPYYTDSTIVIARKGQLLTRLRGILVLKNSSTIAHLQLHYPHLPTIGIDSYQAGIAALQTQPDLAMAGDRTALWAWLQANPDYGQVGAPLAFHSLAIALPKGLASAELRQKVQKTVSKWRQNGWLAHLAQKWGL